MGNQTGIEWTESTWNPLRGCTRISEGCRSCYAERIAGRFPDGPFQGFAVRTPNGPRWTGRVELIPSMLGLPLRWKHPRRVFVNSMSDLFHEAVSNDAIAAVFGIMAASPHLTFQVLTKRAQRLAEWFQWIDGYGSSRWCVDAAEHYCPDLRPLLPGNSPDWPLMNVWVGVSCENQAMAEARIPWLLQTPAAVRFLSLEPLLEPIDLSHMLITPPMPPHYFRYGDVLRGWYSDRPNKCGVGGREPRIDWGIIGCESGPARRPMDLAWARSLRDQCQAGGVAVFVKQLAINGRVVHDITQFPEDLRVRDYPCVPQRAYALSSGGASPCKR